MDCFYHSAVPSVGRCIDCGRTICATCRSASGDCPGCRLGARIDAARPELGGDRRAASPPPPPPRASAPRVRVASGTSLATVKPETRALVALGYPFWPLALIALFDPSRNPAIRRHALQSLGFNAGMWGIGTLLATVASVSWIAFSAWPLLPFIIPVTIIANIIFMVKAWTGDDVHVPFVTEYLEQHQPA